MSDPLDCDSACRAKLILDGDNISTQGVFVASLAENLCQRIEAADVPLKNGQKIAEIFAHVEDELADIMKEIYHAQKLFVDGVGYSGALPKSLQ